MSPRDEKLGCLERDCPGSADSQFISNMIGHVSGNLLLPFSVLFLPLGLLASTISGQLARPESESDRLNPLADFRRDSSYSIAEKSLALHWIFLSFPEFPQDERYCHRKLRVRPLSH